MERRDLMKLFGIGSVIAPVIGGVASAESHVKLVQVPKVEIAQPPAFVEVSEFPRLEGELDVTVYLREKRTGRTHRMDFSAVALTIRPGIRLPDLRVTAFPRLARAS